MKTKNIKMLKAKLKQTEKQPIQKRQKKRKEKKWQQILAPCNQYYSHVVLQDGKVSLGI